MVKTPGYSKNLPFLKFHRKVDAIESLCAVFSTDSFCNYHDVTSCSIINTVLEGIPEFTSGGRPEDFVGRQGAEATFNCITDAEPEADVQWFVNGDPVDREYIVSAVSKEIYF